MSDQTYRIIAIAVYMAAMLLIGYLAFRKTDDLDDYMLAGRRLRPTTAALSAGASDMSGWLLMGLPGAIYAFGLVEAWIAIGLTVGAWLNWTYVAPRLRSYTQVSKNSITVPTFFENRLRDGSHLLRVTSGVIILVFFTFYVSSGMVAGGTFFESAFGGSYLTGMLLVAGVTLAYTLFGGFIGATWTDVVQGLLMLAALVVVPVVAVSNLGGVGETIEGVRAADAAANAAGADLDRLSLVAGGSVIGVLSAVAWGLGYFGQPHIIVRFMALRSAQDAKVGRRVGIGWMVLIASGAVLSGIIGVAFFWRDGEILANPETVFLDMAAIVFHPLVGGLVLAAVLAAIMSTVSSQLIVCSSALVEDLYKIAGKEASPQKQVVLGRTGVLVVAVVAGLLAINPSGTILELVGFAWAGFGAAFGPVILLSLYWRRLTRQGALAGMITGAVVVLVWGTTALGDTLYEIVPGFLANLLVAVLVSRATAVEQPEIEVEFDEAVEQAARA